MRTRIASALSIAVLIALCSIIQAQVQLKKAYKADFLRLEETYNILDKYSGEIWPGWKNYKDVPFLLNYPDGVSILIGHPNPPAEFKKAEGITLMGKQVFIDRSREFPLELNSPLFGGGGPIPFGKSSDGKWVETVEMNFQINQPAMGNDSAAAKNADKSYKIYSEDQILAYIHELFHCYQQTFFKFKKGNFRVNSDLNFAVYSELEAVSLLKAFGEQDTDLVKKHMKEFLVERYLKNMSFPDQDDICLSDDEFMEGGATYSELKTLQMLKNGYSSVTDLTKVDTAYTDFKNSDGLISLRLGKLSAISTKTLQTRGRAYQYGLYIAMIMDRIIPDWKNIAKNKNLVFDQILKENLKLSEDEKEILANEIKNSSEYKQAVERHAPVISSRDSIYNDMINRKGRKFIVNFKPLHQFPSPSGVTDVFDIGLISIYPKGFDQIKINEAVLKSKSIPLLMDQIYYVTWVDENKKPKGQEYEIEYKSKENDIYYNAVVKTDGFTLTAPKIQITENPVRIKINILSSVTDKK